MNLDEQSKHNHLQIFFIQLLTKTADPEAWVLFVDESSNKKENGVGIVLERH